MRKIFKDNALNEQFHQEGFVVLEHILHFDFEKSYRYFNGLPSQVNGRFYASLWSKDRKYREEVNSQIKQRLDGIAEEYLEEYVPFFGDLLVKKPSLNHTFDWHQDWTFVDEKRFASVYIWCPLQDVNKRNGCLMVLPQSHLAFRDVRGSNIQPSYEKTKLQSLIKQNARVLAIKKGDVIIFNQALFHASPPNRTLKNRLAIGLLCLPKEAEIFHYHFNLAAQKIEKYKIDYDFIMNFSSDQDFLKNLYSQNLQKPAAGILLEPDNNIPNQ